jgi:hypothetical protein
MGRTIRQKSNKKASLSMNDFNVLRVVGRGTV